MVQRRLHRKLEIRLHSFMDLSNLAVLPHEHSGWKTLDLESPGQSIVLIDQHGETDRLFFEVVIQLAALLVFCDRQDDEAVVFLRAIKLFETRHLHAARAAPSS